MISKLTGVRLAGVASAIPERTLTPADDARLFGEASARRVHENIGVNRRNVASGDMCASDLCLAAAERLLAASGWPRDSLDALIFVSQTPDYLLPATSCSLHGRLKLEKHCAAFDVNLGCSGYVYGGWLASLLISSGSARRVLLLVGDTISRIVSPEDQTTMPLFGDAGTATLFEQDLQAPPVTFALGTDGGGQSHLMVPAGAFRHPHTEQSAQRRERENGNRRSDEDLFMNGAEIFTFTLREVPKLIQAVTEAAGWSPEAVDGWVLHQANRFMLQHLAKRMRLPREKVVLSIEDYGNTSSASIPLTMTHALRDRLSEGRMQLVMAGFGVGYSWGAAALTCERLIMPGLITVPDAQASKAHQEDAG